MAYTSKHNGHSGQCHQQTNNNQKGEARDKEQTVQWQTMIQDKKMQTFQ